MRETEHALGQTKHYLALAAYQSLLRRADEYEEKDWNRADRFERHAINAALDLQTERMTNRELLEALRQIAQVCTVVTPSTATQARLIAEAAIRKAKRQ